MQFEGFGHLLGSVLRAVLCGVSGLLTMVSSGVFLTQAFFSIPQCWAIEHDDQGVLWKEHRSSVS